MTPGLPFRSALALSVLLAGAAPAPAPAAESYDNCAGFITALPAVISKQGVWCMDRDLATAISSGQAIRVTTNNVTIDCNGFKLGNLAAGAGTLATGIDAFSLRNTTIRGCNVRGFRVALSLEGLGAGHVLEDNRIEGAIVAGISMEGDNQIVRRNQIIDIGGATGISSADSHGIRITGQALVEDNFVSGVDANGNADATGIEVVDNIGSAIRDNVVVGVRGDVAYGIRAVGTGLSVRGNDVLGDGALSTGIYCTSTLTGVRENSVSRFTLGIAANCEEQGNFVY